MIANGNLEIQEQESGTYVFPVAVGEKYSWALFVYNDGTADLWTKRDTNGGLLGSPIRLPKAPSIL